jgi:periplasmic divalent cation tolerance protein
MTSACIVLTTAGSREEADKLALALVDRRLAACVNIVPQVHSVYRWQEKVERATEWLLVIKTQTAIFERLRDTILELHSYELPECIAFDLSAGSQAYLDWIAQNTR